jgi:acetyl esterase/lipase
VPLGPVLLKPFLARRRDVERIPDLAYGEHGVRNLLDVYVRRDRPQGAPVFVYLHGGAWVTGKKDRQGLPIVYRLAHDGWLCVAPNYRLGPSATFPDQLVDVKRVLAWVQEHAREHGGDPTTVFLCGGSAGGHLTALAALTPNDPSLQPGFEDVDTSVVGAIPLYGDYDWLDTHHERERRGLDRTKFLVDRVLKVTPVDDRSLWELGSPLYHVRPEAPPFFVVHGSNDTLLLVEDTRHFVDRLSAASTAPVAYAELPGGQHAFDGFQSVRCGHVINGIERFTSWVRSNRPAVTGD